MKRSPVIAIPLALTAAFAIGTLPAQASTTAYTAGPFSTLSTCQKAHYTYVKQGGFDYVGPCYKNTNNRYYFTYR